ncbi:MAG: nucleoside-diphosphate kinase [archaeon]
MERTLVMVKPDGVKKKLVGRVISRIEDSGLAIDNIKMFTPTKELVGKHYAGGEDWKRGVGEKTAKTYAQYGIDMKKALGTDNLLEIGTLVRGWLIEYLSSGPVVAIVVSGNHAVDNVRKLAGATVPIFANPGTIRGDWSIDSPDLANGEKRAVENIVHASGTVEEAEAEIKLWFPEAK